MQVICVGVSHKTSPVELREQLALDEGQCVHIASGFLCDDSIGEAVALSTCNRTELYLYAEDASAARSAALARLAGCAGASAAELEPYAYVPHRPRRHRAPLPRGIESRLDGRRRGADPGADQGGPPDRRRLGLLERRPQQGLPPRHRGGQTRAHRDGHRRAAGVDQLRRRGARPPGLRQAREPRRPDPRGRRDERAHGDPPQGAGDPQDLRHQPYPVRRTGARRALRRLGRRVGPPRGAPRHRRHRHLARRQPRSTSSTRRRSSAPCEYAAIDRCS